MFLPVGKHQRIKHKLRCALAVAVKGATAMGHGNGTNKVCTGLEALFFLTLFYIEDLIYNKTKNLECVLYKNFIFTRFGLCYVQTN